MYVSLILRVCRGKSCKFSKALYILMLYLSVDSLVVSVFKILLGIANEYFYTDNAIVATISTIVTFTAIKITERKKPTFKTEIIPATEFDSDTIVKVYSPDNSNVYRTYRINFWKKPPLQDVDGMRRYPIAKVTCTDTYEEVSPPENTFDMDFGTRWAADSSLNPEQWIMFELDDIYPIERIGVAWMSGTARQYTYKLEISVDGKNWTTVFDGKSSGTNAKCEYLDIGGQMAKFVRYTGSGNTVNKWNSVTEVEILGNKR